MTVLLPPFYKHADCFIQSFTLITSYDCCALPIGKDRNLEIITNILVT